MFRRFGKVVALTELPSQASVAAKNIWVDSCTILCVEDNPINMLVVRKILQQRSTWRLIEAVTGESGFDLAINDIPDLILRLRGNALTQEIPVVAVSANADSRYIQDALLCGFDRYITKPIRFPDFLATIEDLLAKTASSRKVT